MFRQTAAVLIATLLPSCLTPVDDIPAPPVNSAISNTEGSVTFPWRIECDGPEEEVALLGKLCGASTMSAVWKGTDADKGMATALGPEDGPVLLVYNRMGPDPGHANVAAEVKYSAYVLLSARDRYSEQTLGGWRNADVVSAGAVTSQWVRYMACEDAWIAEGTFTWRSTQLRVAWAASRPC